MNPNDKLTERDYSVHLTRAATGSGLSVTVRAVSPAQAQRKALDGLAGWTVDEVR